ncbi:MAG: Maf family protein [Bacteroidales bacterium]|nr:Maf family protein [Clostridium sp.]MCM1202842.1 Maf family protein [Bacteroidales bacterium]
MIKTTVPIILASASPRRAELLKQAGFTFTVHPSAVEENVPEDAPDKLVEALAFQKADDVYRQIKPEYGNRDFVVIGADTVVFYQGEILGKPEDAKEAFDMLKLLSDRTHQVFTGIAIILKQNGIKQTYLLNEKTDVTFYPLNDDEIKDYIATGDSLDKAGAYGIQGPFAVHVKEICGDYNNVVGLPIARLYQTMITRLPL